MWSEGKIHLPKREFSSLGKSKVTEASTVPDLPWKPLPVLLLDQFDPAVLGSTLLGVVGGNGGELAAPVGSQAGRGDAVVADERLADGLGPVLGELDVAVHAVHLSVPLE